MTTRSQVASLNDAALGVSLHTSATRRLLLRLASSFFATLCHKRPTHDRAARLFTGTFTLELYVTGHDRRLAKYRRIVS